METSLPAWQALTTAFWLPPHPIWTKDQNTHWISSHYPTIILLKSRSVATTAIKIIILTTGMLSWYNIWPGNMPFPAQIHVCFCFQYFGSSIYFMLCVNSGAIIIKIRNWGEKHHFLSRLLQSNHLLSLVWISCGLYFHILKRIHKNRYFISIIILLVFYISNINQVNLQYSCFLFILI